MLWSLGTEDYVQYANSNIMCRTQQGVSNETWITKPWPVLLI